MLTLIKETKFVPTTKMKVLQGAELDWTRASLKYSVPSGATLLTREVLRKFLIPALPAVSVKRWP